jgi:hypothetical protein
LKSGALCSQQLLLRHLADHIRYKKGEPLGEYC